MHQHMVTMDPPDHTKARSLLTRLFTPKRVSENEAFMLRLAAKQLGEFISDGKCEFVKAYAEAFTVQVIADLLGVPEKDHDELCAAFGFPRMEKSASRPVATSANPNILDFLDAWFTRYVEERRRAPTDDVLSKLALATYPDGSTPQVAEITRVATFLFAAGRETSASVLAQLLRHLAERPELYQRLRAHRELIPNVIEEVLRMEGPVKSDFRMARRTTQLAGVEIKAGAAIIILPGAVNRDPRRFESPQEFRIDRPNAQEHIAFGRGIHSCPGAALARAEARITAERILDEVSELRLSQAAHGDPGAYRFEYKPFYGSRALNVLHLEFTRAS
jgi:cytochrome P450